MKGKFLVLLLMTAIVLSSLVIAATNLTTKLDGDLTKADNTVIFTVKNPTGTDITNVNINAIPDITDGTNSLTVSRTPTGTFTVPANGEKTFNLTYSGDITKFALGTFSTTITLVDSLNTLNTTLNFVSSFCDDGVIGTATINLKNYELTVAIDDIKVEGFGPEDNEWYPLDSIELTTDIENKGDEDIDDILIEACLYDEIGQECVVDEDDMDFDDDFKLKDGDGKSVIISYKVDPDDIKEAGDFVLYIKTYSDELGEDKLCVEDSEPITIVDDEFVVLDDVNIPATATCGELIEVTADVWNVGSDTQDEVSLGVVNKELGIDQKVEVGDIDEFEKEAISFTIQIPEDAKEKTYNLKLSVYDEDDDVFETEEDEEESVFNYQIAVGDCAKQPPILTKKDASISATLESDEVIPGEDVIIKATVMNTGEEKTSYSISLQGYDSFSLVQSINPSTLTLDAGKSQDVLITLKLNKDATGEQVFTIKALFDSEEVKQQVSLSIQPSGVGITGSVIGASLRENWFIWVIVLINIILIIAIIIVAARMSKA